MVERGAHSRMRHMPIPHSETSLQGRASDCARLALVDDLGGLRGLLRVSLKRWREIKWAEPWVSGVEGV